MNDSKKDSALEYILSDLYRYTGRRGGSISFCHQLVVNHGFRYMIPNRLYNSKSKIVRFVGKFLCVLRSNSKIEIPPETKIGYGLYIGHGGPLIINRSAIIGNNVNLSQYTTIGSIHGNAAIIGDNVYIGPMCCLVENVRIGNNATIGAGSIVTKDIPDNATAVGNYAKVINYNNPGRFVNKRWDVSES